MEVYITTLQNAYIEETYTFVQWRFYTDRDGSVRGLVGLLDDAVDWLLVRLRISTHSPNTEHRSWFQQRLHVGSYPRRDLATLFTGNTGVVLSLLNQNRSPGSRSIVCAPRSGSYLARNRWWIRGTISLFGRYVPFLRNKHKSYRWRSSDEIIPQIFKQNRFSIFRNISKRLEITKEMLKITVVLQIKVKSENETPTRHWRVKIAVILISDRCEIAVFSVVSRRLAYRSTWNMHRRKALKAIRLKKERTCLVSRLRIII